VSAAIYRVRQRLPFPMPGLDSNNRIYALTRLYINYFQPVMKLMSKNRHGAKVYKVYDTAQTPYQRLLRAGILTEAKRYELTTTYHGINPLMLLKQINENLEKLWAAAHYLTRQAIKVKTYEASVT